MNLKILQVIDQLNLGGAERLFTDLSNLLYEEGVAISTLTFLGDAILNDQLNKNIDKVDFFRNSKYDLKTGYRLSKILNKFDIIHVHSRHNYRYIKFISLIFFVKTPILLHDHRGEKIEEVSFLFKTFLKPKYYIGVSSALTNWAKDTLGVKKDHVFLLTNFVRKQKLSPNSDKSGAVIVGNIKRNKNQLFAIKLLPNFPELELTIIGNIQEEDYYKILLEEIDKLNLKDRVHFVFDEINAQKRLPEFSFGLMTSIIESGPLVLIEYLAQSLPFVAHNIGSVSKITAPIVPNYYVSNFNETEWIQKIKNIEETSCDLYKVYNDHFSPKIYLIKCLEIYQKIAKSY